MRTAGDPLADSLVVLLTGGAVVCGVQEEVVGDPHWLDNRWAEKDRILAHFGRTGQFPLQVSQITQSVSQSRGRQ